MSNEGMVALTWTRLLLVSVPADPAIERADQILGPGPVTLLPADQFDALLAALDQPPRVIPELARIATRVRRSRTVS